MMHSDFRTLLYRAEIAYFDSSDLDQFRAVVDSARLRVQTYKHLRDHEVEIFQPIADQLVTAFPTEDSELLESALKHWLSVLRYCAMAMLINDPDFLKYRLLEWLVDVVQAYDLEAIETHLSENLYSSLQQQLTESQWELLCPFLQQAEATLIHQTQTANVTR